jgi:hypothetical protein
MNKVSKFFVICVIASAITSSVFAAETAFQASLTPDAAIYPKTQKIEGLTLSIWGNNPQTSIALGIVNGTSGDSKGVSIGFANYGQSYTGLQFGFANADDDLKGLQFGVICSTKRTNSGIQIGLLNFIKESKWFSNFPNELAPFMILVNWRILD